MLLCYIYVISQIKACVLSSACHDPHSLHTNGHHFLLCLTDHLRGQPLIMIRFSPFLKHLTFLRKPSPTMCSKSCVLSLKWRYGVRQTLQVGPTYIFHIARVLLIHQDFYFLCTVMHEGSV